MSKVWRLNKTALTLHENLSPSDRSWFVEQWITHHTLEDVEEILKQQNYTVEEFGSSRVRAHFLNTMRKELAEKAWLRMIEQQKGD